MNLAILIGRLTRDPELKYIPSTGKAVTTFTLAVERPFTTKDGQKQADFFNIVVWGRIAENCANYLSKGKLAGVKGQIQNRSYDNQNGEKRYVTEIIASEVQFLEKAENKTRFTEDEKNSADVFTPQDVKPKGLNQSDYKMLEDDDVPF